MLEMGGRKTGKAWTGCTGNGKDPSTSPKSRACGDGGGWGLRCESLKRIGSYTAGTTRSFALLPRYVFIWRHLIQSQCRCRASLMRDECIREVVSTLLAHYRRETFPLHKRPRSKYL